MILSLLIILPIFASLAIMLFGKEPRIQKDIKTFALLASLAELVIASVMYYRFVFNHTNQYVSYGSYHFVERYSWIPSYHIDYFLGVDALSIYFILLTALLTPLCFLVSWNSIKEKCNHYFGLFLMLEGLIIGFFSSLDLVLFYIFFEAVLIPMFFIIGRWGGENRVYATFKFFLYTFFGSIFMLVAILYILNQCGSSDITRFTTTDFQPIRSNHFVWFALFIAFAVKIPMWPFHTWLPDAHVQAPTGGSVMLAGVLLKMGGYGMLRVLLPLMPYLSLQVYSNIVQILSIIAIIYTSFVALAQTDIKKMIAYSSIAHMGYVTAGIFLNPHNTIPFPLFPSTYAKFTGETLTEVERLSTSLGMGGISGAMIQMISHGLISAALFLIIGMLYERTHTKEIKAYSGLANKMPLLSAFFMLFMLGSIGLPGTSGFIGEFMVILATFSEKPLYGLLIATGMVLGASYMLTLYQRIIFVGQEYRFSKGPIGEQGLILQDLSWREIIILSSLAILVLLLGLYPKIILPIIDNTIYAIISH